MFISPGPIAFQIGVVSVHWYGIMIGVGILLCYAWAVIEVKRRKAELKHLDGMAFWVIMSGIIGSRLYYVLFYPSSFLANPAEILQVWKGGLAIHGALIGGAAAYFIYVIRHRLPLLLYADIIMPGILLAQALGRWGNFFNSEAFGTPTSLPWKLFIPEENRPELYADFSFFHPTFLYESIWNLLGFILLVIISRKAHKLEHGYILGLYLMWYSFGRFFIEILRTDSLYLGPLKAAQAASILMFLCGAILLIFLRKKPNISTQNTSDKPDIH